MQAGKPNKKSEIPVNISTEIFIKNWTIYKKIIQYDNMSHKDGYGKLREVLLNDMKQPFSFLDLACGDAQYSSKVLIDTQAQRYIGVDVSEEALAFAQENFTDSTIASEFIRADFVDFPEYINGEVGVVWVGFSVHHLETGEKLDFMKDVKKALSRDGMFMLYEPILLAGESRDQYYSRFKKTFDLHWRGLSKDEAESLLEHVRETEKPETAQTWINLGRDAGFSSSEKVFSEKTGLYEIFKYKN